MSTREIAMHTPLIPLRYYYSDPEIRLKPEMLQPIGSYKIRGVYNWVVKLTPEQRAKGIFTASSGNMAQALTYVAKLCNIPARAMVFDTSLHTKKDSIKKYGGKVVAKSRVLIGGVDLLYPEKIKRPQVFIIIKALITREKRIIILLINSSSTLLTK